jgi:carbamate kinase
MQDSNRGWRRTIASPQPLRIVEAPIIAGLARGGTVVIACGGGGIAVRADKDGMLEGVEAVVDKDRASALLAIEMSADLLMIPTGIERVAIRFGRPDQQWLDALSVAEAQRYVEAGEFGEGSMRPKIEALLAFVRARRGARGIVTNPENIARALRGESGTRIES